MRFLSTVPFLLISWTMFIFGYQNLHDKSYGYTFLYTVLGIICIYIAKNRYKTTQKKPLNIIAVNIAMIPLLFSNITLSPMILQGKPINESGMIFVLVLIYSPVIYVGTLFIVKVYLYFTDNKKLL